MIIRQVTKEECHWLDKTFNEGEIVYRYMGATYKCIGETGLAFALTAYKGPFFQLPKNAVAPAHKLL
jgi:hypothetical protein